MWIVVVLAALALDWLLETPQRWRRPKWFRDYYGLIAGWLRTAPWWQGPVGVLAVVAPAVIVTLLVQGLIRPWLFGLPFWLFATAVLFVCLGPVSLPRLAEKYSALPEASAQEVARDLGRNIESPPDAYGILRDSLVEKALQQFYGVLFWFLVLGPAGAVVFRMAAVTRNEGRSEGHGHAEAAERLLGILEWVPARLLALSFALGGAMDEALGGWRTGATGQGFVIETRARLLNAARGALRIAWTSPTGDRFQLAAMRRLLRRSLAIWLAVMALLTLGGWLG